MLFTVQMRIEGLNAHQVVDKLARGNITVFSAIPQKNAITLEVARKDCKKVFAILRGSCYNVKKVSPRKLSLVAERVKRNAGLLIGLALAVVCVCCFQTRVLAVRVIGSGSYYEREVRAILEEGGMTRLSALPKDTAALTAQILSLPRVSFCNIAIRGGVVTVEVQVSDEWLPLQSDPLRAPVSGVVESLVVVRGTPLVTIGDEVTAGQTLIDCRAQYGEKESTVIVVAYVRIAYDVSVTYRGSEAQAIAQAFLDYGELSRQTVTQVQDGWLVSGTAYAEVARNID